MAEHLVTGAAVPKKGLTLYADTSDLHGHRLLTLACVHIYVLEYATRTGLCIQLVS